jgi:4-hydroxybenzoate polyprenyltransferase
MTKIEHKISQSYMSRLWAYLQERFPLFGQGILIVSYFSSNQFVALSLLNVGEPVYLSSISLPGGILLLCIFFHLRVFDEHKDYEEDCVQYPDRILSRGIFTLKELKYLGYIAVLAELLIVLWRGPEVLLAWFFTFIFSLLMLKEFFVSKWLKERFLVYAATHMCIMPLIALTVFSYVTQQNFWEAPLWFFVYAFVGMFVTLNWEVSRKIRSREDEKEGVVTYSSVFGAYNAANLVLAIRVIDTTMVFLLGYHLGLNWYFYAGLLSLFLFTFYNYQHFQHSPTSENAKNLEKNAAIYIIGFDLILALSIAATNGLKWG